MRRLALWVLIAALLGGLMGAVPVSTALAENAPVVALGFGSNGWTYQQVAYDGEPGFQDPAFDDSAWAVGQAGFGTTDGVCPWNNADQVHTAWSPGTDMLLRHSFTLPAGASAVHISGTVDNNADVYVNGTLVQHAESGFCTADGINADVPDGNIGQDNVVAIRGRDLGSATFIDVQITYDAGGGGTTTVISHSYVSVEYIESFSTTRCVIDLVTHGFRPSAANKLCLALRGSVNSTPPSYLDSSNLAGFAATKEYRGLMRVPSYEVTCSSAGQVLSVSLHDDSPFYASLGYTKVPIAGVTYQPGESFNPQDPTFDTGTPTILRDPDGAVIISYRWASRLATFERRVQYDISGYDAPFIWLTFDEKIGCDGRQAARFHFTDFPSTDLYINGLRVSHDKQTNNIAKFIKQGGTTLHPPGYGNLAFPCHIKQFDNGNPTPVYSYTACQDNQLPPGAGTGGGGNL